MLSAEMIREKHTKENRDYGHSWVVAEALLSGPKSTDEIIEYFGSYLRFAGLFGASTRLRRARRGSRTESMVREALRVASARGWIAHDNGRYALTPAGRTEAEKILTDMRRARAAITRLLQPITVSKVSLAVHFLLAAIKFPAAILSGSIALLNDGVDTLLDGVSSVLVYFGIRWKRERMANILLIVFMLGTGGWTLAEAIRSFFERPALTVDWLAVAAALVSGALCTSLWAFQRFVGLRSASPALITQSVDSRNHVIVAVGVLAGLGASALRFPWLDRIVGLAIALLILKSAVDLLIEVIRAHGNDEIDFSRYRFGVAERYKSFRTRQFRSWLLYFVAEREPVSRKKLTADVVQTLDFRQMPTLRELGVAEAHALQQEDVDTAIDELIAEGCLEEIGTLRLTAEGHRSICRSLGRIG